MSKPITSLFGSSPDKLSPSRTPKRVLEGPVGSGYAVSPPVLFTIGREEHKGTPKRGIHKMTDPSPTTQTLETLGQIHFDELSPIKKPKRLIFDLTSAAAEEPSVPSITPPPYVQMLRLLESNESAVKLSKWLFDLARTADEKEKMNRAIDLFFANNDAELHEYLIKFANPLRKHFQAPLTELIDSNRSLLESIFLSYIRLDDRAKAQKIGAKFPQQRLEYPSFPYLSYIESVENMLKTMIEHMAEDQLETVPSLLSKAFREKSIDQNSLDILVLSLKKRILHPGATMICEKGKESLLRKAIAEMAQLGDQRNLISLQEICLLDLDHILEPQFEQGNVKGLHVYPTGGQRTYSDSEKEIHVRCKYPQVFSNQTRTAPIVARVSSNTGGGVDYSKISTFPQNERSAEKIVQEIEAVLRRPINKPNVKADGICAPYFGPDSDGAMRVVWVKEEQGLRSATTSYHIPFFDVRDMDPAKEVRTIRDAMIQHEEGAAPVKSNTWLSPQKALKAYVHKIVPDMGAIKRTQSNQELLPLIKKIQETLSKSESSFTVIPTEEGKPIILESSFNRCGYHAPDFFNQGYRPSVKPEGAKKRLSAEEIRENYGDISFIVSYPNWETLAQKLLQNPTKGNQ